jgi:hypothetical protein
MRHPLAMARELGLNPSRFGQLGNHRQKPRKAPLQVIISELYVKRFGVPNPRRSSPSSSSVDKTSSARPLDVLHEPTAHRNFQTPMAPGDMTS